MTAADSSTKLKVTKVPSYEGTYEGTVRTKDDFHLCYGFFRGGVARIRIYMWNLTQG